jgi:hypothetical protein
MKCTHTKKFVNTFLHFCQKKLKYFLKRVSSGKNIFASAGIILPFEGSRNFIDQVKNEIFHIALSPVESASAHDRSNHRRNRKVPR